MALSRISASAAQATTVSMPAHAGGDLLLMFAFRDGSTTAPTVPAGWISIGVNTGTSCASVLAYRVALTNAETSGTWTNATAIAIHVYRGQATNKTPVSNGSAQAGTGTTVNYSGLSPMQCPDTSWLAAFAGHTSVDTALETPPANMGNRSSAVGVTAEIAGHDTNQPINSYAFNGVAVGGTSGNWIGKICEIFAEHPNIENYKRVKAVSAGVVSVNRG